MKVHPLADSRRSSKAAIDGRALQPAVPTVFKQAVLIGYATMRMSTNVVNHTSEFTERMKHISDDIHRLQNAGWEITPVVAYGSDADDSEQLVDFEWTAKKTFSSQEEAIEDAAAYTDNTTIWELYFDDEQLGNPHILLDQL